MEKKLHVRQARKKKKRERQRLVRKGCRQAEKNFLDRWDWGWGKCSCKHTFRRYISYRIGQKSGRLSLDHIMDSLLWVFYFFPFSSQFC